MPDRFTSMQVFARVAGLGSFAATARAMSLSQTMVTTHVTALESQLGVRLLQRSTRRLSLTEAGRVFLEGCQRVLADLDEVEHAASADRLSPRGVLRLNAPVSFAIRHLAPLLAPFSRRFPEVIVELGLNDRVVDLVDEGWELTIRIGRMADSGLIVRRLAALEMVVCASPAYLARRGVPRTVADLGRHDCLGYTLSSMAGPGRWLFGASGSVAVDVAGALRANNGDALREAALAGLGVIYQPTFLLADELRSGRLVVLKLDHACVSGGGIHLVSAAPSRSSAKARVMSDFLANAYADPPWSRDLPVPTGG